VFDKNFNIVLGGRASGRTFFLWETSKVLKSLGYKICFLGCTNEFDYDDKFLSHFDFCRTFSSESNSNNPQIVELVKEVVERDKYDFIFIDDMDVAYRTQPLRIKKMINSISVCKISTCLTDVPILGEEFNLFNIKSNYDDSELDERVSVEYKGNTLGVKKFLLSLSRELKINNVLK
jgi:hypothetical protein